MKVRYKKKMMLTLSIFPAVLLLISTIFTSMVIKNTIENQNVAAGKNTLAQLQSSVETIVGMMNNSMVQLALDSSIQSFSDRYELLDVFDREEIFQRLYQFRAINQYIDKLYIYYYQDEKVLDLNGKYARMVEIEDSQEADTLRLSKKRCMQEQFEKTISIFNGARPGEPTRLMAAKASPPMTANVKAVIVVFMKPDYFQKMLQSISLEPECNLEVIDDKNQFLFGKESETSIFNAAASPLTYGGDYISIRNDSDEMGWSYIYQIPQKQIQNEVNRITFILWMITGAIFISAIFFVRFLTKELYKPVNKVIQTISSDEVITITTTTDEMQYINENIRGLIEEKKKAQRLQEQNKNFIKDSSLQKLLLPNEISEESWENRLNNSEVSYLPDAYYVVAVVSIHEKKSYVGEEFNQLTEQLQLEEMERIREVVSGFDEIEVQFIRDQTGEMINLLFSIQSDSYEQCETLLKALLDELFKSLIKKSGNLVTLGVGEVQEELSQVYQSYQQAKYAEQYHAIVGENQIIYANQLPAVKEDSIRFPFKLEQEMFFCLKQSDTKSGQGAVNAFFDFVRTQVRTPQHIRYLSAQLLYDMTTYLQEISINISDVFGNMDVLFNDILQIETVDEMQMYFDNLLQSVQEYVQHRRREVKENRNHTIIEYVDEHYCDEDISLDQLADVMHFSVSYLSKVFKSEVGKSFKEYITEKRIEKAKGLLRSSNYQIQDVARMVGYSNARSFINIFKKNTGVTPGVFKDEELRGHHDTNHN